MLRFYFDTKVYDSIAKGRVSENDLNALQSALTSGKAASNFSTQLVSGTFAEKVKTKSGKRLAPPESTALFILTVDWSNGNLVRNVNNSHKQKGE